MSILNNLGKKVNKAAKVVSEKSGELVEAGKLKVEIEKKEMEQNRKFKELGKATYKLFKENQITNDELLQLCGNINSLEEKIAILKQQS